MRQLPAFRNYPASKKNFKKTLREHDYYLAVQRAEAILLDMQIRHRPGLPPIKVGVVAYIETLQHIETIPTEQLGELYEEYTEVLHTTISPDDDWQHAVIDDHARYSNTLEAMNAISREMRKRSEGKFFNEPFPHKISLNYQAYP